MKKSALTTALDKRSGSDGLIIVEDSIEKKIRSLHSLVIQNLQNAFTHWLSIGELLVKKKEELPHGQFIHWVNESDLGFNERQAQKYMKAYYHAKEKVLPNTNSEFVFSSLDKINKVFSKPKQPNETPKSEDKQKEKENDSRPNRHTQNLSESRSLDELLQTSSRLDSFSTIEVAILRDEVKKLRREKHLYIDNSKKMKKLSEKLDKLKEENYKLKSEIKSLRGKK